MKKGLQIIILTLIGSVCVYAQDGFGRNTTGGAGGSSIIVSNATDFVTYVTSPSPYIITVSGTITLGGNVYIQSNKTIQGADTNATIDGDLYIGTGMRNVIIRYLNINNTGVTGEGDGITIFGSKNIFVSHCTFTDCRDGSCDVTEQADSVTIAWCRFRYVNQTTHKYVNLIGANDGSTSDLGKLHVTFHHCWYDQNCLERMPSVRYGRVHTYNNYFSADSNNYCVRTRLYAECLVENNYFENVQNPWELLTTAGTTGKLRASGNNVAYLETSYGVTWVDGWYTGQSLIPGTDVVFTPPYSYSLDSVLGVKSTVMEYTGNKTPFTITATAGANGSITPVGVTSVGYLGSVTYSIVPDAGYHIDDVLVDGSSVGAVSSYTFSDVASNHTISASFEMNAQNLVQFKHELSVSITYEPRRIDSLICGVSGDGEPGGIVDNTYLADVISAFGEYGAYREIYFPPAFGWKTKWIDIPFRTGLGSGLLLYDFRGFNGTDFGQIDTFCIQVVGEGSLMQVAVSQITISWGGTLSQNASRWELKKRISGTDYVTVVNNMGTGAGSYTDPNTAAENDVRYLIIKYGAFTPEMGTAIPLSYGWNLVSVPCVQSDYSVATLFPHAMGPVAIPFIPGVGYPVGRAY